MIQSQFGYTKPYYTFCREEQNVVALLYSLLLNNSSNLKMFLEFLKIKTTKINTANSELYFEYAYVRDLWHQFTSKNIKQRIKNNDTKRNFILSYINSKKIKIDNTIKNNSSIEEFNNYFGCRAKSKEHIESPSNWSVLKIKENIYDNFNEKKDFIELCKFKWSFNIKPDLIIKLDMNRVICIEAKLESNESSYPSNSKEKNIWDEIFGKKKNRVKQTDMQKHMLSEIIGFEDINMFMIDSTKWSTIFKLF